MNRQRYQKFLSTGVIGFKYIHILAWVTLSTLSNKIRRKCLYSKKKTQIDSSVEQKA